MKSIIRSLCYLLAMSMINGNAFSANLLDGISNGNFESGPIPGTFSNGIWYSATDCNCGSHPNYVDLKSDANGNHYCDVYQESKPDTNAGNNYAKLWYTANTSTSTSTAWKISAQLKWNVVGTDFGTAKLAFSLISNNDINRTPLFSIIVSGNDCNNGKQVFWSTPTNSGVFNNTKGISYTQFTSFSVEYDPTTGYTQIKMDDAALYTGVTNEGLALQTVLINNYTSNGNWNAGNLYVDNVQATPMNHTSLIFHSVPGGTFDNGILNNVPGGTWSTYANWSPSASVTYSSEEAAVDLYQEWQPHTAQITYSDIRTTTTSFPWKISAALKGTYTNHSRTDKFALINSSDQDIFSMSVAGIKNGTPQSTITWVAGNKNGTVFNKEDIGSIYKNVSIEYHPSTGLTIGKIGNTVIFETNTQTNLTIQKVAVSNITPTSSIWDPGHLYVDNFKAEIVTELSGFQILHSIDGGSFTTLPNALSGTVNGGYWDKWAPDPATSVTVVGSGSSRHAEIAQTWYPRSAGAIYTDYNTTPENQAWRISADIKGSYTRHYRTDRFDLLDQNSNIVFSMCVKGLINGNSFISKSTVTWIAGPQTSSVDNIAEINTAYQSFSFEYQPKTGESVGKIGEKIIFKTNTDILMKVKKIQFSNQTSSTEYDPGILFIDNVKSTAIQNQEIRYRGIAVTSLDLATLSQLKNDYGINQVRYYMAPVYKFNGLYNSCSACDPTMSIIQGLWNEMINSLPQGLENARSLGIAVVINLHQLPYHYDLINPEEGANSSQFWSDPAMKTLFLNCWQQIINITKNRNQSIWLELYNEPFYKVTYQNGQSEYVVPPQWPIWAQDAANAIRSQNGDLIHHLVIASGPGAIDRGFRRFSLITDNYQQVIYTLHQWELSEYTHQGTDKTIPMIDWGYPDIAHNFTKHTLQDLVVDSKNFQKWYGVRLWVGEFGVSDKNLNNKVAVGAAEYIKQSIDTWENNGWDWSYWAWDSPFQVQLPGYEERANNLKLGLSLNK